MAKYGTRYPVYAIFDGEEPTSALPEYQTGKVLGKLASVNITINAPEAQYYADDTIAEEVAEFISGDGEIECDNISDDDMAALYGADKDSTTSEIEQGADDTPPYFGFGFVVTKMVGGAKNFVAHYYPKCKARPSGVTSNTKGESISFTGEPFTFTVYAPLYGGYHYFKTFSGTTAEADAKGWVDTKLNVSSTSGTSTSGTGTSGTGTGN